MYVWYINKKDLKKIKPSFLTTWTSFLLWGSLLSSMLVAFSHRLLVPAAFSLQLPMLKPVTKAYLQLSRSPRLTLSGSDWAMHPSQSLRPGLNHNQPWNQNATESTSPEHINKSQERCSSQEKERKEKKKVGLHFRRGNKCGLKCPQPVSCKWKHRFATSY